MVLANQQLLIIKNKSINTIRFELNKVEMLDELVYENPKVTLSLGEDKKAIYNLFTQVSTKQQLDHQLIDVIIYFLNSHKLERLKYYYGENLENFNDENSNSIEINNIKHNILKEFHCQNLYDIDSEKLILRYLNSKVRYIYNYFRDLNTGRILNHKIVDKIIKENSYIRKLLFLNGLTLNLKNVIIKDIDMWRNMRNIVQNIITNLTNELNTDIFSLSYEEFLELYHNGYNLLLKK